MVEFMAGAVDENWGWPIGCVGFFGDGSVFNFEYILLGSALGKVWGRRGSVVVEWAKFRYRAYKQLCTGLFSMITTRQASILFIFQLANSVFTSILYSLLSYFFLFSFIPPFIIFPLVL